MVRPITEASLKQSIFLQSLSPAEDIRFRGFRTRPCFQGVHEDISEWTLCCTLYSTLVMAAITVFCSLATSVKRVDVMDPVLVSMIPSGDLL